MVKKKFLVTNGSDGSISLVGRTRIDIPGNCKNHIISLAPEKSQAIISRLKRTYPRLKIVEAPEQPSASDSDQPVVPESEAVPEPEAVPELEAVPGGTQSGSRKKSSNP